MFQVQIDFSSANVFNLDESKTSSFDKDLSSFLQSMAHLFCCRCHYPGTITTPDAIRTGKPLWASEDYSTFNDIVGGGCWARVN